MHKHTYTRTSSTRDYEITCEYMSVWNEKDQATNNSSNKQIIRPWIQATRTTWIRLSQFINTASPTISIINERKYHWSQERKRWINYSAKIRILHCAHFDLTGQDYFEAPLTNHTADGPGLWEERFKKKSQSFMFTIPSCIHITWAHE